MKKIKTTIYIREDIYQKLIDIVHKYKQAGYRNASNSNFIEKAIELYDMKEQLNDGAMKIFKQQHFEKTGNYWS